MSNPLPILRGTSGGLNAQVLYPFTRSISFLTNVQTFANGSEQRAPAGTGLPLYGFSLPMTSLNPTDKAAWLAQQNAVKGQFAQNITVTLGATTYSNLTQLSDSLAQTNTRAQLYNQQISLRQVQNYPFTLPSALSVFPTLSFGASCELPFTQSSDYLTGVNDNPAGPRFAWGWYGSGLTGFPGTGSGATATTSISGGAVTVNVSVGGTNYVMAIITITGDGKGASAIPVISGGVVTGATTIAGGQHYTTASATITPLAYLRSWRLEYPLISDADAATLESAFTGWQGRYASFTFVDPLDGIAYTNVRCDQDDLQLRGLTVNQQSTTLLLRQTNGS